MYAQPIAQWHQRGSRSICEYILEDGTVIRATPDHQMMTSTGEMVPIDQIFEQGLDLDQIDFLDWSGDQSAADTALTGSTPTGSI
jgi:DNA polymerase-3 subunit alpha